jgi:hypothetical protein
MDNQIAKSTPSINGLSALVPKETKIPSISDVYNDTDMTVLQKDSAIQVLLNQVPNPVWIKEHPIVKIKTMVNGQEKYVPLKYMPIERLEWLLTVIFLRWRVEIKSQQIVANSLVVVVRVHYYDHAYNDWNWTDGIGAQPLQIDKGSGAIDFNNMKSNAVQLAAPAAESYAVKDACEKLGRIFGKDLNRQTVIDYEPLRDKYKKALE